MNQIIERSHEHSFNVSQTPKNTEPPQQYQRTPSKPPNFDLYTIEHCPNHPLRSQRATHRTQALRKGNTKKPKSLASALWRLPTTVAAQGYSGVAHNRVLHSYIINIIYIHPTGIVGKTYSSSRAPSAASSRYPGRKINNHSYVSSAAGRAAAAALRPRL